MLTTDLRALTVRQPFGWRIMTGEKEIEYRSWKTHYRGALLIHASSKVKLTRAEAAQWPAADVYGVVLGSVILERIEGQEGDYEWCLRDPRPLATPIRCVGGLQLWKPPEPVLAAIPGLDELLKTAQPTKAAPVPKASSTSSRQKTSDELAAEFIARRQAERAGAEADSAAPRSVKETRRKKKSAEEWHICCDFCEHAFDVLRGDQRALCPNCGKWNEIER